MYQRCRQIDTSQSQNRRSDSTSSSFNKHKINTSVYCLAHCNPARVYVSFSSSTDL
ncbi:hypothetical protein BRADI_4g13375v3 [Brachypodium distachyon]|uniref:Uncharacterized protein n=1 Tax=Brachypodium distachyon TaxID=15368 RepID=A0A2K2CMI5_BRADI|nr:hypothetical protein BRADI_4g13375v3 [Brachypodium distachyon]